MAKDELGNEKFEDASNQDAFTSDDVVDAADAEKVASSEDSDVAAPAKKSFTEKKGTRTRTREEATTKEETRTTPVEFVQQSAAELKKVVWPTKDQLVQYFFVVLIFVLFIIAYVGLLDMGFGAALLAIFGGAK